MIRHLALLTFIVAFATGCTTPRPVDSANHLTAALERLGVTRGDSVKTIQSFRINGWQAIDERHLVLTAGVHDHYLLTLAQPCRELRMAFGITFDTATPSLSRMDSVVVNAFHGPLERCSILDIIRLDHIESPE
ncbi:MAG: DUF6491 family protein [Proteobacteria bacterium]|nr:DUF6491 family protein [Pseudomonadota bacterium]